jgi:tetratricopeptide (TPR) repeat protein
MSTVSLALSPPAPGGPSAADLLRAGREHYKRGEFKDAIAIFQAGLALVATISIGPGVDIAADLHAALANAFMLCDDLDSAAENYRAALRLAPRLVACWCNLGNVHLKTGMAQQAIALYLEALRLSPGHRPSRTNLVQALVATRQYVLARVLLLELLEETPDDAGLLGELGKVCFELKQVGEAIEHFERAAALAPERAENFDSTDMASHDWMQREEEQFLRDPGSVFCAHQFEALRMSGAASASIIRHRLLAGRGGQSRRVRGQRLHAGA